MTSNAKLGEDDSRFSALTSDRFDFVPGKVDKYGRKNKKGKQDKIKQSKSFGNNQNKSNKTTGAEKRLDYLTRLSRGEISGDSSSSDEDNDSDDNDNDDNVDLKKSNKKSLIDGDDDNGEEGDEMSEEVEHIEDATTRLAIQNCDWMHIKAEDLFVVLQSFCPSGQVVKSVGIYPSNFGLERMAEEEKYGPAVVWREANDEDDDSENDDGNDTKQQKYTLQSINSDDDSDDDDSEEEDDEEEAEEETKIKSKKKEKGDFVRREGSVGIVLQPSNNNDSDSDETDENNDDGDNKGTTLDELKLREYELAKLKYYFAVAEFDSPQTAETVYAELDGLEFASSSMLLDLRFIPDEIEFKDRVRQDYADNPQNKPL